MGETTKIIDVKGLVLGRLASEVAEKLLRAEEITIVNAEKAIVVGSKDMIISEYKQKRKIGDARKGPYYPRMPDKILRRTIRGMIPYQTPRGREAYKRLKVYISIPKEFEKKKIETIEGLKKVSAPFITLGDVCKALGAKI